MSTPTPPPASAATAELHRRFCSDVPNDGTYTLHLNETETIRFFAEADRLIAAHTRAAVERETADLRAENDRLTKSFMDLGAGRVTLEELAVSNGRLTAVAGGEIVQLMAEQLYKFMKDGGAINYMESQFSPKDATKGRIIVNCRWETGKTPHELRTEAEAKLTAAEGTVAQLRTRLDTAREALEGLLNSIEEAYQNHLPHLQDLWSEICNSECTPRRWHELGFDSGVKHVTNGTWDAAQKARVALASIREGEKPS